MCYTELLQFKIMFENSTVHLSAICNLCTKIACCSSELIFMFLHAGGSKYIMQASNSSREPAFLL